MESQHSLYDVLIGVDKHGSSAEMNKALKEIAQELGIEDIPARIGSKNLLKLTADIREALENGVGSVSDQSINKLGGELRKVVERSFQNHDLKRLLGVDVMSENLIPKNFFGGNDLDLLKDKLASLGETHKLTIQSITKNAEDQVSVMVTGIDEIGNKTTFALSKVDGEYKALTTRVKNEFESIFNSQKKALEKSGQEIVKAMKLVEKNPGNEVYKQQLKEINEAHDTLLQNMRTMAESNQFDNESAKERRNLAVEEAEKVAQKTIEIERAHAAERAANEARVQSLKEYEGLEKSLQEAIKQGRFDEAASIQTQMGAIQQRYSKEKDLVRELETSRQEAARKGSEAFSAALEKDMVATRNQIQQIAKAYKEASLKGDLVGAEAAELALDRLVKDFEKLKDKKEEASKVGIIGDTELTKMEGLSKEVGILGDKVKIAETNAETMKGRFGEVAQSSADIVKLRDAFQEGAISAEQFVAEMTGLKTISVDVSHDASNFAQIQETLTSTIVDQEGKVRKVKLSWDDLEQAYRVTGDGAGKAQANVQTFSEKLVDATKKISLWGISTKIVYGVWNAFKDGIKTIEDLDTQLTQIAVVQGKNRDAVKHLGSTYADTAVEMSQLVTDVAKLNTELVRQGLSIEESGARADTIMKLSAAGAISLEQSLQVITSGTNALKEEHEKIADVILKASNITASSVEGLGEAFTKTASGAEAAGLTIEQTTALISTMKDVTQEGDAQLGTSLKSILARFSRVNEMTGEVNQTFNDTQKAIEYVGIQFTETDGQMRNTYDILADLALIWDDLDRNTQAYVATQAAGTRQQNRFYAVMNNFNKVQGVQNDLLSAGGSLQKAYSTYTESSEAATKRLKASMERMWINLLDSDVLIFLKDIATGILNVINSIGSIEVALAAITTGLLLHSKTFQTTFFKPIIEAAVETAGGLMGVGTTADLVAAKATLMGTALKTAMAGIGIGLAVAAIAFATSKIIGHFQEQKRAAEEARKASIEAFEFSQDIMSSSGSRAGEIQDLGEEYLRLDKIVKDAGGTYALTKEELARYYDGQARLKELLPEVSSRVDSQGRVILENVAHVEGLIEMEKRYQQEVAQKGLEGAKIVWEEQRELLSVQLRDTELNNLQLLRKQEEALERKQAAETRAGLEMSALGKWLNDRELKEATEHYDKLTSQVEENERELLTAREAGIEGSIGMMQQAFTAAGIKITDDMARIFSSDHFIPTISTMPIDEAVAYVQRQAELLKRTDATFKVGPDEVSMAEFTADMDSIRSQMEAGQLSGIEYNQEIDRLLGMIMESGMETQPIFQMLIGMLEGMRDAFGQVAGAADAVFDPLIEQSGELDLAFQTGIITQEEYRVQLERLKAELAAVEYPTDDVKEQIIVVDQLLESEQALQAQLEGAPAAYSSAQSSAEALTQAIFDLNDASFTQYDANRMIMDEFPEYIGQMGDKQALEAAMRSSLAQTTEASVNAYIDQMRATSEFTQGKGESYWNMLKVLAPLWDDEAQGFAKNEALKEKAVVHVINSIYPHWRQYFLDINGQFKAQSKEINNFVKQANKAKGRAEQELGDFAGTGSIGFNDRGGLLRDINVKFDYEVREFKRLVATLGDTVGGITTESAFKGLFEKNPFFPGINEDLKKISELRKMLGQAQKEREQAIKDEAAAKKKAADDKAKAAADKAQKAKERAAAAEKRKRESEAKKAAAAQKKKEAEAKRAADKAKRETAAKKKKDEAAAKKAKKEAEKNAKDAAKKAEKAKKDLAKAEKEAAKAKKEALKAEVDAANELIKATNELTKAQNEFMKQVQNDTKEVFDFAVKYIQYIKKQKEDQIQAVYDKELERIEEAHDLASEAIDKELAGQLEILDIKQQAIQAEEEALKYLEERRKLQDNLVDLEYKLAIASLDGSTSGAAKRRTLEEALAEERANLQELETERFKKLETDAYAVRRALIEGIAQREKELLEKNKTDSIQANLDKYNDAKAKLEQIYSDENVYLLARQATQTGMIENLKGEMIPLKVAFEELAKANGEFWTFFGQEEVKRFGSIVTDVVDQVKKLGFETIQMWKEVALQAEIATDAINEAHDAANRPVSQPSPPSSSSGGGSSSSSSSSSTKPPTTKSNTKPPTTKKNTKPSTTKKDTKPPTTKKDTKPPTTKKDKNQLTGAQIKKIKAAINRAAAKTKKVKKISKPNSTTLTKETKSQIHSVYNAYFQTGSPLQGKMKYSEMIKLKERQMSKAYNVLINTKFPTIRSGNVVEDGKKDPPPPAAARPGNVSGYSKGGKIEYTGPAEVHGSKKAPEYIFNYPQFKDLARMIANNQIGRPQPVKTAHIPQKIDIQIGNMVNIEGNATKDSVAKIEKATQNAMSDLKRTIKGWGK